MTAVPRNGNPAAPGAWRRRGSMVQDAILVCVSALFLFIHAQRVLEGVYTSIPFAVEQLILTGLFLVRRRSQDTSRRPIDWVVATVGGWGPLLMRPTGGAAESVEAAGTIVQVGGLLLVFAGFLSLGRSFGVVAANRGVKTGGMYRLVRHPIYFAHTVTLTGFLMVNPSPLNWILCAAISIAQVTRLLAEERVLLKSSDYRDYASKVRWRLVPGLF